MVISWQKTCSYEAKYVETNRWVLHICLSDDFADEGDPFDQIRSAFAAVFDGASLSVLLDVKSRAAPPELVRDAACSLTARGINVFGVGWFFLV